jgi:uncharacterized protein YlxW (UPF0749 family)
MENILDYITWEMAFTVVGLSFAIILGVSGFLINHLRNKKEWSEPLNDLENELLKIQGEYEQLDTRVRDIKENLEKHDARDSEDFKRIEGQIERLTDLVIKSLMQDK